jgi:nitroreductase
MEQSGPTGATNSLIESIVSRSSTKKFADDSVSRSHVEAMLAAAVRAPDHGLLAPWKFVVLQGDSRHRLGSAMRAALKNRMPDADSEALDREASKALRSPVLIVVAAEIKVHPKVPEVEQVVAVGAAIQNLWLAAHSLGYGAAWKTGSHAYDLGVKSALGLRSDEQIIGFLHIGRPVQKAPIRPAEFAGRTTWL